jgi:hypothetical protein
MIADAWMQHPTERFMAQPWLASLKRWKTHRLRGHLAVGNNVGRHGRG